MGLIDRSLLLEISSVAIELGLDQQREGLLSGIDRTFVSNMSRALAPGAQLLSDLTTLDAAERLSDGSIPLRSWLENAMFLSSMHARSEIFQQGLDAIRRRLDAGDQRRTITAGPRVRRALVALSLSFAILFVVYVLFRDSLGSTVKLSLDDAASMAIAPSETTSIALQPEDARTPNARCASFTYCVVIEGLGAIPLGRSGVLIAPAGSPMVSSARAAATQPAKEAPARVFKSLDRGTRLRGELWKLDGHEYRSCGAIEHEVSDVAALWTIDAAHCE